MINWLDVRDFVVVKKTQVSFESGMTVITGETGAGKSVLVDALSILLGGRASADLIRYGSDYAEIQADFDIQTLPQARDWLRNMELTADAGECTLRRLIYREKSSRGFINGKPVPIQSLRDLGKLLADIHGQHEHHRLLRREVQRFLLDSDAGILDEVKQLGEISTKAQQLETRLNDCESGLQERKQRESFLRHQVQELELLKPDPEELSQLEARHSRLSHTHELAQGAWQILQELDQVEEVSASALIIKAAHRLSELSPYDSRLKPLQEQIEGIATQLTEVTGELQRFSDGYELDPMDLEAVDKRMTALHDAGRKYQVRPGALKEVLESLKHDLEALDPADHDPELLRQQLLETQSDYDQLASVVTDARGKTAAKMSQDVNKLLPSLGLEAAAFRVRLDNEPADRRGLHGTETPYFELQPGPDLDFSPLEKAASGGELSRVSLAIQLCAVQDTSTPCTIYDEVDVGIGGRVAEIVGQKLRSTATNRQVLCITHLPQVAAQGHHHLRVNRINSDETEVNIESLEPAARVDELARMLGGVEITQTTRAHADELISRASK